MIVPFDEGRLTCFEMLHGFGTICAIVFNLGLLYLILTKTSDGLRSYAVILFTSATCDLMTGVFSGVTMMRNIPSSNSLVLISHGTCRYFGSQACIAGQAGLSTFTSFSFLLIPLSFWYRHHVLFHKPPLFRTMVFVCASIFAGLFILGILFTLGGSPQHELHNALQQLNFTIFPRDTNAYALHGFENIFYTKATPLILTISCTPFPCLSVGMYFRRSIMKTLNKNAYSTKTKRMQENFVTALTLHCCVVLSFVSLATLYLWRQLELPFYDIPPYYEEMVFVGISLVTLFNPLITITFVLPYRRAVLTVFRGKNASKIHSATANDHSHSASRVKSSVH